MKYFLCQDVSQIRKFQSEVGRSLGPSFGSVPLLPLEYLQIQLPNVPDPADADYLIWPVSLFLVDPLDWRDEEGLSESECEERFRRIDESLGAALENLPFFKGSRYRHVFFQLHDLTETLPSIRSSVVFKHSTPRGSSALAIPYHFIRNRRVCSKSVGSKSIMRCRYDVSFRGKTHYMELRRRLPLAIEALGKGGYQSRFQSVRRDGCKAYARDYFDLLNDSKFILCPRGIGLNSVRFFETIAFGRIPILISDEAKLPLEGVIPYDDFVLRVPEGEVSNLPLRLDEFLATRNLESTSRLCREVFNEYFALPRIGHLLALSLMNAARP